MSKVTVKTATKEDGDAEWAVLFDEAERLDIWVNLANCHGEVHGFYINTTLTSKAVVVNLALPQEKRNETLKEAIDRAKSEKNYIPLIFIKKSEGGEKE